MKLYEQRKQYQLSELDTKIQVISAKCRFILEIVNDTIVVTKKSKSEIQQQLVDKGYPQFNDSYDYLVKLPIYTLSQEEIDKLLKEKDELVSDHKDLSETTNRDMWLSELHLFEKLYNKTRKIKI